MRVYFVDLLCTVRCLNRFSLSLVFSSSIALSLSFAFSIFVSLPCCLVYLFRLRISEQAAFLTKPHTRLSSAKIFRAFTKVRRSLYKTPNICSSDFHP